MKDAITKLAKALGLEEEALKEALTNTHLALVWDPDEYMPNHLMAVYRTAVTRDGERSFWWTLKPTDKGKHANRSTGEVHKWKT